MAPAIWKTLASPPWAAVENRNEDSTCHHGINKVSLTPNCINQIFKDPFLLDVFLKNAATW